MAVDGAGQTTSLVRAVTVRRFTPKSLSLSLVPSRDRRAPYAFSLTGKLTRPDVVSPSQGCSGTVTITVKRGTKAISTKRAEALAHVRLPDDAELQDPRREQAAPQREVRRQRDALDDHVEHSHRPPGLAAWARFQPMDIEGVNALVAGGASGLGAATARRLHEAGANVTIADLNPERGAALAEELGASFVAADVTDADQVAAAVDAAAGDDGLRISVCCAGIGWAEKVAGGRGPHGFEPFETVIRVNLIGTFNVLRLASNAMLANTPDSGGERGVHISTASIAAFDGQIGQIAYSASKGGIVGMTLPAARDLAQSGIRVCAIAPGLFDTPAARRPPRGGPQLARRLRPVPAPPGPPGRVRRPRRPHRRELDAQRRSHPPGRGPAYGTQIGSESGAQRSIESRCAGGTLKPPTKCK